MAKPLLFAAAVANFFLIVSSSAKFHSFASSSASSSSSYASSSSHSKSFAIATSDNSQYDPPPPCDTPPTAKPHRTKKRPKCPPPVCGPHEFHSNCIQADCAPQNCTQLGYPIVCARVDQKHCKKGCLCKEGYARNSTGVCIPVKECPFCGGDPNAESDECASNCGRLCSNYKRTDVVCTLECPINGCQCKKGYVFDTNTNQCVLPCDCTPTCGKHEVFNNCTQAHCAPKDCTQLGFPIFCPRVDPKYCKKGCLCEPGYVRNSKGVCVPVKECRECGGDPNAEGDECASNCGRLCSNYKRTDVVCTLECPINGCQCKKGYVFDTNTNQCVLPCDCTPTCGKHEVFNNCTQAHCAPKDCTQLGFPIFCPRVDPKYCKKGCLCEPGYVRNSKGVCVPVKECRECGGDPNAEGGECASNCGRLCSNYNRTDVVCPFICVINGCQCKKGYVFDTNTNQCVLPCDCTPTCGKHEVFSNCTQANCAPKDCTQLGFSIACPRVDPKYCKKGCLCEPGYVRNSKGVCVPVKECPKCGGDPNAEGDECASNCGRLCSNYKRTDVVCTLECPINGCQCKKGYVFDTNTNQCVLPCDCTPTCGKHEVFNNCTQAHCAPKDCTQLGFPIFCPRVDPKYCKKGCLCEPGYLRNSAGVCIPMKKCPKCGGDPNAEGDECASNCGRLCSNYKRTDVVCPLVCEINACQCKKGYVFDTNTNQCVLPCDCTTVCREYEMYSECINNPCPVINCSHVGVWVDCLQFDTKFCVKGCVCQKHLMREDDGSCVPIEMCKTPVCKKDEVYSECINGGCTPKNCSEVELPIKCVKIDPKYCIKGCLCKEGYLREDDGTCVPEKKCKKKCTKPNECYDPCGYDCPSQSCKSIDKRQSCPLQTSDNCKPICKCKDGFFRNLNGECISKKHCLQCPGPHEYWSCGGACDNVCKDMHLQNQEKCPIVNIKCNEMCYCEKNYARAKNGTCIPIEKCNEPQCDKNERYEKCPARLTEPQKCSELGRPLPHPPCSDDDKCPVKPACVCITGYVRNKEGICIPKTNCTFCGDDPNAQYGCGINCNKKCEDLGSEPDLCITECKENACDCKDGYYYEKEKKKCVPACECPPVCKKDEVYSECINGGCTPKNCSEVELPIKCVKIDRKYCIKGCLCKEGYLREDDGTCVPEKKCKKKCTKPNEYYDPCGYDCPSQSCKSIDKRQSCPLQTSDNCKPICKCKDGFFRNLNGECISKKHCLQCPGPHEYWSCGGACDNVCKDMHLQNQEKCPIVNIKCNEMCYCEKNYARAKNGTCIPIEKCNEPQCDKNERYEKCPARLTEPQKCSELGRPLPHPPCSDDDKCPVKPACVCITGYVRNKEGICIPKTNCTFCGDDPNAQYGCGINCNKKCEDLGSEPDLCITECKENACDCKDGYYYEKEKKKCVPACECPGVCKGANEAYEDCTNPTCQPRKCCELGFPLNCTEPPACMKGCACKNGYVKNEKGICVTPKECGTCGGDENAESGSGVNCLKKCYDLKYPDKPKPCPKIYKFNACDCKKDFYLDEEKNKCVRAKDCPGVCKGANEVYEDCRYPTCQPTKCCEVGFPLNCTDPPACVKGCACKNGYVRNEKDTCVTLKECGTCGGDENAESGSGVNCLKKCYDLQYPDKPKLCPRIYKFNACDCKNDFYLDEDKNKCVRAKDCPHWCPENEVYDSCVNGGCGYRNCSQLGGEILCIDPIECRGGCTCKKGYLRLDCTGKCVPEDQCPESCTKPNEIFVKCPSNCPETCENLYQTVYCPLIKTKINESDCIGECRCKEDFYRNVNGDCVCKEDCLKCTGAHEYFACGPECDNVCCDLDTKSKDNCPIKNVKCKEMCYCEDGYARDKDGVCICIDDCPERTSTNPKPDENTTCAD